MNYLKPARLVVGEELVASGSQVFINNGAACEVRFSLLGNELSWNMTDRRNPVNNNTLSRWKQVAFYNLITRATEKAA